MQGSRTLAQRCRESFSNSAWHAGEDYSRQRRVQILTIDRYGLVADVNDRDGTPNNVELDWSDIIDESDISDEIIDATCTCARAAEGHLCKHVAAVVQMIDRHPGAPRLPGTFDLTVLPVEEDFTEMPVATTRSILQQIGAPITVGAGSPFALERPLPPAARKEPAQWRLALKEFASTQTSAPFRPERAVSEKQRLFYRINLEEQRATSSGLHIEFIKRVL
ncbi:MAG TPA: SWIM zinc finger family protein [Pirellulales bacterium]|nr:SWIM zinc finger family protein [Pirellulales bacterium]